MGRPRGPLPSPDTARATLGRDVLTPYPAFAQGAPHTSQGHLAANQTRFMRHNTACR